jgi:hypothetical protein
MGQKPEREDSPAIRSDRLDLDFGRNKFRIDEKSKEPAFRERKLPPEPGRVPPATSVPWPEVLNPNRDEKKP